MTTTIEPAPRGPATVVAGLRRGDAMELRAVLAVALVVACHASAFSYTLHQLGEGLDLTSPVVYVPFVPLVAMAAAAQRWRRGPDESDRVAHRVADAVVFTGFAVVALAITRTFPAAFTTETLTWRADLAAVPFTAAAVVVAVFGLRMLWRLRTVLWFLSVMSPALYRPIVGAVRVVTSTSTGAAVGALGRLLPFVRGTSVSAGGRVVEIAHGSGSVTLRVAEVCAGNGAVLSGLFVGGTMWLLCDGTRRAKLAWTALCVGLCWAGNLLRLVAIFGATARNGSGAATGWFHDVVGMVGLVGAIVVALAFAGRFGLSPRARRSVIGRDAGEDVVSEVAMPRLGPVTVAALAVLVIAGAVSTAAATSQYDLLAGASQRPARSTSATLHAWSVAGGPGGRSVVSGPDVSWAPDYFGSGATWKTFYARGSQDAAAIGIDVIATDEPTTFDTYGLAACFGFHGWRTLVNRTFELPGRRRGEEIVYVVRGEAAQRQAHTVGGETRRVAVVSWRQRSSDGRTERVTLQQPQPASGLRLADLERLASQLVRTSDAAVVS